MVRETKSVSLKLKVLKVARISTNINKYHKIKTRNHIYQINTYKNNVKFVTLL